MYSIKLSNKANQTTIKAENILDIQRLLDVQDVMLDVQKQNFGRPKRLFGYPKFVVPSSVLDSGQYSHIVPPPLIVEGAWGSVD